MVTNNTTKLAPLYAANPRSECIFQSIKVLIVNYPQ